jgi:hypothetical protein
VCAPGPIWRGVWNLAPTRSESLYRLSYPVPSFRPEYVHALTFWDLNITLVILLSNTLCLFNVFIFTTNELVTVFSTNPHSSAVDTTIHCFTKNGHFLRHLKHIEYIWK